MIDGTGSELPKGDWEIINENPYLEDFFATIEEAEKRLNDPECHDDEASIILAQLENGWLYMGTVAKLMGTIHPYDDDEVERTIKVDTDDFSKHFRFVNIERIEDANGCDRIAFGITDAMADPHDTFLFDTTG